MRNPKLIQEQWLNPEQSIQELHRQLQLQITNLEWTLSNPRLLDSITAYLDGQIAAYRDSLTRLEKVAPWLVKRVLEDISHAA